MKSIRQILAMASSVMAGMTLPSGAVKIRRSAPDFDEELKPLPVSKRRRNKTSDRSQRQIRKDRRRRHAAGDKGAFRVL